MPIQEGTYGLLAEFDTPTSAQVVAARAAHAAGYRRMDCSTRLPGRRSGRAIGFHRNYVPLICLLGGSWVAALCSAWRPWFSLGLSGQRGWTSLLLLASLRYSRLRVDHHSGRPGNGLRHASHERTSDVVSPFSMRRISAIARPRTNSFLPRGHRPKVFAS